MGEVAASWVSIYPKIGKDFGSTIRGEVQKAMPTAFGPMDKAGDEAGKKTGKKFGDQFKGAVSPILAVASVAAIGAFVDKSVSAFAELQDATAAAGVVFGDSMSIITDQADKAAASFGISKQQAIDASITFGTFGKSAGLAGVDLANFSTKMTALAGDMASFRGTSPEEAIEAIGAAMRGEAEPIRKYGVLLDDATLRARALTLGLIDNVKSALTPQQKVLAAQAEILAQTSDAQGDFARTADSTANVQKRLAAESANLSAAIGEKLAPAIVEAQKAGIGLISWATDNQAVLVPLIGTMAALTAGVMGLVGAGKAMDALKSAKATIQGLGDAFQSLGSKAKLATLSLGAVGIALTIGAALYGMYAGAQEKAKQASEDYVQSLKADSGALGENTQALMVNRLEKEGALAAAQKFGISSGELVAALVEQGSALEAVKAKLKAYTTETQANGMTVTMTDQARAAQSLIDTLGGEVSALDSAKASSERVATATTAAKNATTDATQASKDHAATLKDEIDKLHQTANAQLALSGSQISLEAAYDSATDSIKENGKTLDTNTQKGRNNRTALDAIATAGNNVVESLVKTGASGKKVAGAMDDARGKFIKVATQMGMSKKAAEALATKLGLIKGKDVKVKTDIDKKGINAWDDYNPKDKKAYIYTYSVQGGGSKNPRDRNRAYGGPLPGWAPHDRADNVTYQGTPGEWVIQKPTVRYYGDSIMAAINAGRIPKERLQGYAYGGKLGEASTATPTLDPADIARAVASALNGATIQLGGMGRLSDVVSARILTMARG